MNAGLTNLETLKRHLLAGSLQGEKQFDAVILVIGLGVAGLFETFTNRRLGYQAGDEIIFAGNRRHYILPRFPLVSVSSVQMRWYDSEPWGDISGEPVTTQAAAGMVRFCGTLGGDSLQVRVVWSGGYWFETLDPEEDGYPSQKPAGAAELPGALKAAFLLQCEQIWQQRDKLGTSLIDKPAEKSSLAGLELSPLVKQILQGFIRYQLS